VHRIDADVSAPSGGRAGVGVAANLRPLLRCDEWLKNVFVFAGVLFTGPPFQALSLWRAALAFGFFSAGASAVYIHNDIADWASDRRHPVKRNRPIAAGRVTLRAARAAQAVLLLVACGSVLVLPMRFAWLLAAYVALNVAYSGGVKRMVI